MEHTEHTYINEIKEKEKKQINNRLNRIEGQLNGIRQMIENNICCDDILIQVSAVSNSIKSLGRLLIDNYIRTIVMKELKAGNDKIIEELVNSIAKLK